MKILETIAYSKIWVISNFYNIIHKIFLEHPNSTDNPQGYWAHGIFSGINSLKLIGFGSLGVIHAIIPCVFKFSTSSYIIRCFVILAKSNRHKKEIKSYISYSVLEQLSPCNKSPLVVKIIEKYDENYELDTSTWD